jgi:cell division transport system permease protein
MLVLTLLTVDILLMLNSVTDTATQIVEQKIDVSVYFNVDTPEETVKNASGYLQSLEQVRDVIIITPQEALERFKDRHQDDEVILSSLDEVDTNPFGHTLVVKAYSTDDFDFIIEALSNPQYSEFIRDKDYSDYETIINRIDDTTDRVKWFGIALSGVFLLISVLIIFNTVRMGIFVHREEIGIMKLVGATNWFVKGPFFVEAIIVSCLALLISLAILFPSIEFLQPKFDSYLGDTQTGLMDYFISNSQIIFGIELLGLIIINFFSNAFAMTKYLRV